MIERINDRISATEIFASKLKGLVSNAVITIEASIASKMENNTMTIAKVPATSERNCDGGCKILKYTSLAALTIGGIGWLGSAALWSKVITFGGFAGLTYSFFNAKSSKSQPKTQKQPQQSTETSLPTSFIVSQASDLIDELKEISNLWTDFAKSNKSILVPIINDESLIISEYERFKLESIIRVPKTLSFPLIEYRNIIEATPNPDKLDKAIKEVAESAKAEIDRVINSQISSYKEMSEKISANL